ncbi:MAG: shikimate kinase [Candidatus Sumerlaeia bacterium]|nr:shikimate kinase [Candidatus Sumerlaeia bacterium]
MTSPPAIVLVGFMGTGKSAVSQILAGQLGWQHLDTDALIVQRAGKPIPAIFAEEGEPHFRDLETQVIRALAGTKDAVVATGGGCVMRVDNIRALRELGMVVNLAARPEVILSRCGGDTGRPLLQTENPLARIHDLLALRAPLYAMAHHTVDTSDLGVAEVAEAILHLMPGRTP